VRLLGQLAVELDGAVVPPPSSRSAWHLIAWLALHPRPHERRGLAARLWPDGRMPALAPACEARSGRCAALGPAGEAYLPRGRDLVALSPDAPVEVDARSFDTLEAAGRLEKAAALATGEFLTGFEDERVLEARDAHRARLAAVLGRPASAAMKNGDPAAALRWTQRQAAITFGE
jgi:DNA-binding SARP family transcriptional activator